MTKLITEGKKHQVNAIVGVEVGFKLVFELFEWSRRGSPDSSFFSFCFLVLVASFSATFEQKQSSFHQDKIQDSAN